MFKWNDDHLDFLRKNPKEFDEKYKFENYARSLV